jgi:hypothetical protein
MLVSKKDTSQSEFDYVRKSFENGASYEGSWKSGPHGVGVLAMSDGSRYRGEFDKGLPHGKGAVTYHNGAKYEGSFVNGLQQGLGTFLYVDGSYFHGQWHEGIHSYHHPRV